MLSLNPSPRLLHRSPDVGSSFGSARIAGEIVVFEGPFDPVFDHATGESRDTERYVCGGWPVVVLGGGAESFKRQIR